MRQYFGLDFGTTNSCLAIADAAGSTFVVRFKSMTGYVETFRSILFFECDEDLPFLDSAVHAGPAAIDRYLASGGQGRLVQSLKTFLASQTFSDTTICGQRYRLEDLIAAMLADLRHKAAASDGPVTGPLTVGRPVHFAGENSVTQSSIAEGRLKSALVKAGFQQTTFVLEPIAAAYHYERSLQNDERLLIADFGGGTSDFSVLMVGPSFRDLRSAARKVLAVGGVALAGDAFDARIVRHAISPRLGLGTQYRSAGKLLPVPIWIYSHLERWHLLSMLKSPKNIRLLQQLRYQAVDGERIDALLHLVANDKGFELYQTVSEAKAALSHQDHVSVRFAAPPIRIDVRIARADFEAWIKPDLDRIADCLDATLESAKLDPERIDRVFMTGGSSFVPAVRRIFEERFGASRLNYGDEFVSVARGLALASRDFAGDDAAQGTAADSLPLD